MTLTSKYSKAMTEHGFGYCLSPADLEPPFSNVFVRGRIVSVPTESLVDCEDAEALMEAHFEV